MPPQGDTPANSEIDQALKQFEMQKGASIPIAPQVSQNSELPRMVRLVMKFSGGAIKEQRQAEYVLLGFVVLVIAISVFIFSQNGSSSDNDLKLQEYYQIGSPVLK